MVQSQISEKSIVKIPLRLQTTNFKYRLVSQTTCSRKKKRTETYPVPSSLPCFLKLVLLPKMSILFCIHGTPHKPFCPSVSVMYIYTSQNPSCIYRAKKRNNRLRPPRDRVWVMLGILQECEGEGLVRPSVDLLLSCLLNFHAALVRSLPYLHP